MVVLENINTMIIWHMSITNYNPTFKQSRLEEMGSKFIGLY
jgi:hypothetical protein